VTMPLLYALWRREARSLSEVDGRLSCACPGEEFFHKQDSISQDDPSMTFATTVMGETDQAESR
jgi:hypothetical protein